MRGSDQIRWPVPMLPILLDRKWGFMDGEGRVLIEPSYEHASEFEEGLAAVRLDGLVGYVDTSGKLAIAPKYAEASEFYRGTAVVFDGDVYGVIDRAGSVVVQPQFEYLTHPSQGLRLASQNEKYGFLDESWNFSISPQFDEASGFDEDGLCAVCREGEHCFIDTSGRVFLKPECESLDPFFEQIAVIQRNGKKGCIDMAGDVVVPIVHDDVQGSSEGLLGVLSNDVWRIVDRCGMPISDCGFEWVGRFAEGYAVVCQAGKSGLIGHDGRFLVPPMFGRLHGFRRSYAAALTSAEMVYVRLDGKVVRPNRPICDPEDLLP